MTAEESLKLLALVTDQYGVDAARQYQLGNGDHVVRIHRMPAEDWFLWDFPQWRQYRRAQKAANRSLVREIIKAKRKRKRQKQLLEVAC